MRTRLARLKAQLCKTEYRGFTSTLRSDGLDFRRRRSGRHRLDPRSCRRTRVGVEQLENYITERMRSAGLVLVEWSFERGGGGHVLRRTRSS
ncbi:MAG TPA: hypothetical protein VL379_06820, partial [Pseudomonadales bacterium]|nr:hypothetical protein [Pseudomonadales bacterium]